MSDIRYGACIEVSTDKEVDCDDSPSDVHIVIDGTADKDSRYEKETRIDGHDSDEDRYNHSSSYLSRISNPKSTQSSTQKNVVNNETPKVKPSLELPKKVEARIVIQAVSDIIMSSEGGDVYLHPQSPVGRMIFDISSNIQMGNITPSILTKVNNSLLKTYTGYSIFNISSVSLNKNLIDLASNKSLLRENYDAVNIALSAYKDLYEKKIDIKLAKDFQTLSQNFKYSSYRVEQAQRRYIELLQGVMV